MLFSFLARKFKIAFLAQKSRDPIVTIENRFFKVLYIFFCKRSTFKQDFLLTKFVTKILIIMS